jgi:hypothetical protein
MYYKEVQLQLIMKQILTIKKGFNETYKKGTDDDLGFKPMPGIVMYQLVQEVNGKLH